MFYFVLLTFLFFAYVFLHMYFLHLVIKDNIAWKCLQLVS